MNTSDKLNNSTDTLLAVISTKLDKVIEELSEVREEMKLKVNIDDFKMIKNEIDDLKKHKWLSLGFAGAVSFFISHFLK